MPSPSSSSSLSRMPSPSSSSSWSSRMPSLSSSSSTASESPSPSESMSSGKESMREELILTSTYFYHLEAYHLPHLRDKRVKKQVYCPQSFSGGGLYLKVKWLLWDVYDGLLWNVWWVTMGRVCRLLWLCMNGYCGWFVMGYYGACILGYYGACIMMQVTMIVHERLLW